MVSQREAAVRWKSWSEGSCGQKEFAISQREVTVRGKSWSEGSHGQKEVAVSKREVTIRGKLQLEGSQREIMVRGKSQSEGSCGQSEGTYTSYNQREVAVSQREVTVRGKSWQTHGRCSCKRDGHSRGLFHHHRLPCVLQIQSVSNRIVTSCQAHRVTKDNSHSAHR